MSNTETLRKLDYNKMIKNTDISKLYFPDNSIKVEVPVYSYKPQSNLMVEEQKQTNTLITGLNEQVSELQNELENINSELKRQTYENMKLNAQITVLNKTIDSNKEKLNELQITNSKLEVVNDTLKDSNSHYWRNTFLISFLWLLYFLYLG